MMFIHHKPSWRSRLRLAWKALRGVPLWEEHLYWQRQQFQTSSSSDAEVTGTGPFGF